MREREEKGEKRETNCCSDSINEESRYLVESADQETDSSWSLDGIDEGWDSADAGTIRNKTKRERSAFPLRRVEPKSKEETRTDPSQTFPTHSPHSSDEQPCFAPSSIASRPTSGPAQRGSREEKMARRVVARRSGWMRSLWRTKL